MRSRCVIGIVVVGLLAGCAGADATTPPATTSAALTPPSIRATSPSTTTTTVPLPAPVPIVWDACGNGLQCATVTVPVDYGVPAGDSLSLALVKRPAGDPEQRLGTLVVNPGGPGASGVRRVQRGFTVSDEVGRRFDIVGLDPRGVGASAPITCGERVPAFRALDLAPDTAEEEAALEAAARAVSEECAATEGARLEHLGTIDVARDLEVIRRAIGEARISFVGLSYGTAIGLLWADMYPTSVRALVLDGLVDPAASTVATSEEQVRGVEDSVNAIADACTADPTCPLAGTGGFDASYDELARRLDAGEVTAPGVGPTQLAHAAFYATYDADHWPRLWAAVADGLAGDLEGVATMAASFTALVDYPTFALITCLDAPHAVGYDDWQATVEAQVRRSPRFAEILGNELLPCAFWPSTSVVPRPVEARGAPPVLVIGSTGDAATPYEQAVRVADTLADGRLLSVDLDGHVAIGDSACATEAATRYLVDLTLPARGARC